jgi:hypothetical protein
MVQFKLLPGSSPEKIFHVSRFPCLVGRGVESSLRIAEPGVWERHFEIELRVPDGFVLRLLPPAMATVNGQPFEEHFLRNGDLIEFGSVKVRFWLSEVQPARQETREFMTWAAMALLTLGQVGLMLWMR